MISKVVIGRDIGLLLRYVETKEGSYLIDTNLTNRTRSEMVDEFKLPSQLKRNLNTYVWHTTLSVEPDENLSDRQWRNLARDYLQGMGFGQRQYAVYRHTDTEHHHIHIVANRIDLVTGKVVSDSWNWPRSEAVVRQLEQHYGLRQVESSHHKREASPTTGEVRMARRTGKTPIRLKIQAEVKEAISLSKSLEAFVDNLEQRGISVKLYSREEQVTPIPNPQSQIPNGLTGISYGLDGIAFAGSKLGKMFSLPQVLEAIEGGRERLRAKYRRQYEQARANLPSGIPLRQVDRALAFVLFNQGSSVQEVKGVLSQSDKVRAMKAEKPEDVYQQQAKAYINAVVCSVQVLNTTYQSVEKD